ncbi:MAG: transcriptional repressor NrdR [Ilumatobacteraceae bacterium]|nr:transcriptional repressor NrdR [Ilumatobacteraceae bacterium]
MHCPVCPHDDTKVIDSRPADDGAAIRRRRVCPECAYRFTTYERLEEAPLLVMKRSGSPEPFDRAKVAFGVRSACKGRPVDDVSIDALAEAVEDDMRLVLAAGSEVTSSTVGHAVLEHLKTLDEVAYLRFASVYKNFDDAAAFRRELLLLKQS